MTLARLLHAQAHASLGRIDRYLMGLGWLVAALTWLFVLLYYFTWPYTGWFMVVAAPAAIILVRVASGALARLALRQPKPPCPTCPPYSPEGERRFLVLRPFTSALSASAGWVLIDSLFSYDAYDRGPLLGALVSASVLLGMATSVLDATRRGSTATVWIFVGASFLFLARMSLPDVSEVVFQDLERSFLTRAAVPEVSQVASRELNRSVLRAIFGVQLVHALVLVVTVLYPRERPVDSVTVRSLASSPIPFVIKARGGHSYLIQARFMEQMGSIRLVLEGDELDANGVSVAEFGPAKSSDELQKCLAAPP